jgi:hypothetical protein
MIIIEKNHDYDKIQRITKYNKLQITKNYEKLREIMRNYEKL